ncbi:very short patch repair endonuclease [Nocardioides alpinus]|uniref:Very short patch repair endonuclease n=2 Tax=Nocardioides alpinus TaxID=748909 RepID=A0ABX4QUQ0_9ACTN|nr:very short patch repair endonuclease [Nocardioides alpinus]PKH38048.1 very short patch repair endonuclease [Nocardioides alpinus]
MRRFRSRDTLPEVEVRRALHASGLRFRLHTAVPEHPRRTIDVAFPRQKVAVFIDGCYWHACPEHGKVPARNAGWWAEKLRRNVERDMETNVTLRRNGWTVIRVWEHEHPAAVAEQVGRAVRGAK